jgi:MSHA biogenesis protein MshL
LFNNVKIIEVGTMEKLLITILLMALSACAARPVTVPDTTILSEIQDTLDSAVNAQAQQTENLSADDSDLLGELIPSLSLDESLLAPVEQRIDISTPPNLPATQFFPSLLAGTEYGVAVSPDVDVNINISLPNVTIEEAMDTIAEIYSLDITRRGNIYSVRPGGLRTRYFTIDYLNVQRSGSSSVQVTSGNNQSGGGNNGNNGNNNNGNNNNGNNNNGNNNNNNNNNNGNNNGNNGQNGGGGGGAGGQIQTSTSTDFWSDLDTALNNLIGEQSSGGGSAAAATGLFGGIGGGAGSRNQSTVTDEGKSVLVQPLTGIIIVTAFPHELDRVEQFINAAQESLRREVIIQVQFLEVVLNKGFQYALDFNTFGQQANNPLTGSGEFGGNADGGLGSNNNVGGQLLSGLGGIEGISNPLQFSTNFTDFDAVFQLLQTRGTTQVISSPQLRVLNNQKALFQDGSDEFFQTQADTTTVASANNSTTNSNNNLQQFFSGISMDITPQISASGEITLHVHPIISAVDEQVKNIAGQSVPLALTTTREIDSVIKAQNGRIVVLGGLAFERNISETAGIPGVSRVPLLGDALEQRQTRSVKSEFIILLKPIVASELGNREVLDESNERFRELNRAIDPFANN